MLQVRTFRDGVLFYDPSKQFQQRRANPTKGKMDFHAKMCVMNPTVAFAKQCKPQSFRAGAAATMSSATCRVSDFTSQSIASMLDQRGSLPTFFDLIETYNNQNALLSHSLVINREQNTPQSASAYLDSMSRRRLILRPATQEKEALRSSLEPALVTISKTTDRAIVMAHTEMLLSSQRVADFDHDDGQFAMLPLSQNFIPA